ATGYRVYRCSPRWANATNWAKLIKNEPYAPKTTLNFLAMAAESSQSTPINTRRANCRRIVHQSDGESLNE
ncbi:MAG: hypothetical protein ACK6A7_22700, partial [Planctomycetota bacterium]